MQEVNFTTDLISVSLIKVDFEIRMSLTDVDTVT